MTKIINAALQVIPKSSPEEMYPIIDKAIACIQKSGLEYIVCPFETAVEGPQDKIFQLIEEMQETVLQHGAEELIINVKLHIGKTDMHLDDKLQNYK